MLGTNESVNRETLPAQIGRFKPLEILGKGAQGIVYLANDPQLERQIAIKTLLHRSFNNKQLINEARNVSQLQHPNIIPLYEIGAHEERPYLVYPYVDGQPLRNILNEKKTIPVLQTVKIISQVLDALGYAHQKNVVHRDLNPANILMDTNGIPKVMDFGISTFVGNDTNVGKVVGTVKYMSPEQINGKAIGPYSDVFSIGIVLFEMLTGISVFAASNSMASMFKIVNEDVLPPSRRNDVIDSELDRIVLKALNKEIDERYKDASSMREDIELYLKNESGETDEDEIPFGTISAESTEKDTLVILRRNMERKKDFPAAAQHVSHIMQQTAGSPSADQLTKVILNDQALCSKLLRLANSSAYGNFGGEIRTVSRAVVILGMEHVRSITMGIIMFQHLKNAPQVDALKNNACNSFLSAVLAKSLAGFIQGVEPEEAFLASMFHKFGKQMTIYYLPDEYADIVDLIHHKGLKESAAVTRILGMSYAKLGRIVANEWDLPENILKGLQSPHEGFVPKPQNPDEILTQLAAFTNEVADIAGSDKTNKLSALERVSSRYKRSFDLTVEKMTKLIKLFINDVNEYAKMLDIDANNTKYYKNLLEFITPEAEEIKKTSYNTDNTPVAPEDTNHINDKVLAKAIADVTNKIFAEEELKSILPLILRTIYTGLGCRRVILMLKEKISHMMHARLGFGDGVNELIPRFHFRVSIDEDIFNEATQQCKDIVILDTYDKKVADSIPDWCQKAAAPDDLILLPISLNNNCIGLIYIDNVNTRLPQETMDYLDTLRKQVAMAIKQKSNH